MGEVKMRWTITEIRAWTKSPWKTATTKRKKKKNWPAKQAAVAQSHRVGSLAVLEKKSLSEPVLLRVADRRAVAAERERLPRKRKALRKRRAQLARVQAERPRNLQRRSLQRRRNRPRVAARARQRRRSLRPAAPRRKPAKAAKRSRRVLRKFCQRRGAPALISRSFRNERS